MNSTYIPIFLSLTHKVESRDFASGESLKNPESIPSESERPKPTVSEVHSSRFLIPKQILGEPKIYLGQIIKIHDK